MGSGRPDLREGSGDFAAYLAARWPTLVRALVLLGCDRAEAVEVAQAGLAHCYGGWDRARRADVDAHVYGAVLDALHRSHRHRPPVARPSVAAEGLTDDALVRHELETQLDALTTEDREVLVLRLVAELDDVQVAEVLDVSVATARARFGDALGRLDLAALQELSP